MSVAAETLIGTGVLHAVDALNSWVRSDSARWFTSRHPRYAIYDYKTEAIRRALAAGQCEHRWIYLTLHCRACSGTGMFTHESGDKSKCRKCWVAPGRVTLWFLETTIQGFKWHTPRERAWRLDAPGESIAILSTEWEPNANGKDLTVGEVARYLMVCEDELGDRCLSNYGEWVGDQEHRGYKLDLGRQGAAVCEFCGFVPSDEHKDGCWHHVPQAHVDWSAYACNACKSLYATCNSWDCNRWDGVAGKYVPSGGNGKNIFAEFKPPTITDPDVRAWLARRSGN